jgi:hypothetical protein
LNKTKQNIRKKSWTVIKYCKQNKLKIQDGFNKKYRRRFKEALKTCLFDVVTFEWTFFFMLKPFVKKRRMSIQSIQGWLNIDYILNLYNDDYCNCFQNTYMVILAKIKLTVYALKNKGIRPKNWIRIEQIWIYQWRFDKIA